jgi:hypothetical protein
MSSLCSQDYDDDDVKANEAIDELTSEFASGCGGFSFMTAILVSSFLGLNIHDKIPALAGSV